jgi:hypothetical protein
MSLLNPDTMKSLEDIFADRPQVPDDKLPPLLSPNQGQCEFCKKFLPLKDMRIIDSGIIKALEPLCPECAKTFTDQARVVCIPCKMVVLWVDPHKENTGFEFKRKHVYHVEACPVCREGTTQTKVLEKVVFFKENNIPYE